MAPMPGIAVVLAALLAGTSARAAERAATIRQDAFACVSWAAWHEYGQADGPWGADEQALSHPHRRRDENPRRG